MTIVRINLQWHSKSSLPRISIPIYTPEGGDGNLYFNGVKKYKMHIKIILNLV